MRGPRDLVVDLDALQRALGSKKSHNHDPTWFRYALVMRRALLRDLAGQTSLPCVWYISCWPTEEEKALFPSRVKTIIVPTREEECVRRAGLREKPDETVALIHQWFAARAMEKSS
jgi:hypothetical protein